jgi:hypothetical protein
VVPTLVTSADGEQYRGDDPKLIEHRQRWRAALSADSNALCAFRRERSQRRR